jgi:hypothetical protein
LPKRWYPISPQLAADGSFVAFAHRRNPETYKPVARTFKGLGLESTVEYTHDTNLLADLGAVGVVNISTALASKVIVRDVACWEEAMRPATPGEQSHIFGTRWGIGFRMTLTLSDIKGGVDINLGTAAAAAEIGLAKASFEVTGFGISDPAILANLPLPGRFDREAMAQIQVAETDIRTYMQEHRDQLDPVPLQVYLEEGTFGAEAEALAVLFATRQLAAGTSLSEALDEGGQLGMSRDVIRLAYTYFSKKTNDPAAVKRLAKQWLTEAL